MFGFGRKKKKKKQKVGYENEARRFKELLAAADPESDEYEKLLARAERIENLKDMEGRDDSITRIEWGKIAAQGLMFGAAMYADLNGHIVLKNPLHRIVPNIRLSDLKRREVFGNKKK